MKHTARLALLRAATLPTAGLLFALVMIACYQPERRDCAVRCGESDRCPNGMECSNGRCVTRGRHCSPLETNGAASPEPCVADTLRCSSPSTVERCATDGESWVEHQSCREETPVCADGVCLGCVPGVARCTGAAERAVCDADGKLGDAVACPPWATACVHGECVSPLQVTAGGAHACAKLASGQVLCWGENSSGQLGTGDRARRSSASGDPALEEVALSASAVSVVAGGAHTCALLEEGAVKCWGENGSGQLGLGDVDRRGDAPGELEELPPVDLGTTRPPVALTAGDRHTCALLDDGTVKCWGANESGQLGVGDTNHRGDAPLELGARLPTVPLGPGAVAVSLDAGAAHTCAVLAGGDVVCWGDNRAGQLGTGDAHNHGASALGQGKFLPRAAFTDDRRAVTIQAGGDHSCALLTDGAVVCWGNNDSGQLGAGDDMSRGRQREGVEAALTDVDLGVAGRAIAISAGASHTCALLSARVVKCWGINGFGTLGIGSPDLRRGVLPNELGDALPAVDLGSRQGGAWLVSALSAGLDFTCAALDGDVVKCWGLNTSGQLGLGDSRSRGTDADDLGDALPRVALE